MEFIENIEREEYTKFVINHINSHFLKSYEWGVVSRKRGLTPHYVGLKDKNKLVATALLLEKKLLKIKVVSQGGGEVSLWQMIVRTSIINGIVPLALSLILVFTTKGLVFLTLSSVVGLFENIFVIICVFMLLYKSDCLALHDIMSKSVVIEG